MISGLVEAVLNLGVSIQQIPAPTFGEAPRAEYVRDLFRKEGLQQVSIEPPGNVYACLPGQGRSRPVIVSAHLDTVFPQGTGLAIRRTAERISGPGIGDNAIGVAGLFGLLWSLRSRGAALRGDTWLVANVGEEGLGDLCGMRAVVERFGSRPQAYIVLEGMSLGQVYNRGLGVRRYRITVETGGGHSWVDYGCPSAVHELARIATQITRLSLPEKPRTTLNIGTIAGGTSVNTIAPEAHFELDLRSEDPQALENLSQQVNKLAAGAVRKGVRVSAQLIGSRPAGEISSQDRLVRMAYSCLEQLGIQPHLNIGSTDANIPLSRGLPSVCIGLTTGSGAHTRQEYIHTAPLTQGLAQLTALVEGLL